MQLSNQQTLPVSQAQAWEALNDISLLQAAIPGCDGFTPTGEHQYEVLITAAIGPVKAKFAGGGAEVNARGPQEFAAYVKGESERWAAVISQRGIKLD